MAAAPHQYKDFGHNVKKVHWSELTGGLVLEVNSSANTLDVEIDDVGVVYGVPIFYHCEDRTTVDDGHLAFTAGDDVLVLVEKESRNDSPEYTVVGFAGGNLRSCGGYVIVLIVGGPLDGDPAPGSMCMFWDIRGERETSITNPVTGVTYESPSVWVDVQETVDLLSIEWGAGLSKCTPLFEVPPWTTKTYGVEAGDPWDCDEDIQSSGGFVECDPANHYGGDVTTGSETESCTIDGTAWETTYSGESEFEESLSHSDYAGGDGESAYDGIISDCDYDTIIGGLGPRRFNSYRLSMSPYHSMAADKVYLHTALRNRANTTTDYTYALYIDCPPYVLTNTYTTTYLGTQHAIVRTPIGDTEEFLEWSSDIVKNGVTCNYPSICGASTETIDQTAHVPQMQIFGNAALTNNGVADAGHLQAFYRKVMYQIYPIVQSRYIWDGASYTYLTTVDVLAAAEEFEIDDAADVDPADQTNSLRFSTAIKDFLEETWESWGLMDVEYGPHGHAFWTYLIDTREN